ncbi:MAG: hypothetical protein KDC98_03355 [Planctomycetes bacterium]|nr:hypothetical protein [Planctomycetota bacterium]
MVLFLHVTSHVDGDPHQGLLQEKGGRGFPHLVFMDSNGEVLAKQRERSVEAFETTRKACMQFLELDRKAKAGDKSVGADLLIARIEMGSITLAEAKEAEAGLGKVKAEKKARIFELMLDLEVEDAMAGVRTRTQAAEVGRRFAEMWGQGRAPKKGRPASTFFGLILEAAAQDKDAKLYERALAKYEKVAPQGKNRERTIERLRKRLDDIR